jgi:hypothetical protein
MPCQRKEKVVKALSRFGSPIPIQEAGAAIAWIFPQGSMQRILFCRIVHQGDTPVVYGSESA